jgi:NDP-sugar pyrophosphorylase family protein
MLNIAILCGGLATRMRPLTLHTPKSLLPVNGEPFIAHQLRYLSRQGVQRVVLCVGYLGEMIEEFVKDGSRFDLTVEYSFDGPGQRGTAGALRNALPKLSSPFFIQYGDSYLPTDYTKVLEAFERSEAPALMTVFRNNGMWDVSNACLSDNGLAEYNKRTPKPYMDAIDYGLLIMNSGLLERDNSTDLADVLCRLSDERQLAGYQVFQPFFEIGSISGLQNLANFLTENS